MVGKTEATRFVCTMYIPLFPTYLSVYIYWPKVNLYQVVVGQQSVRTLFKSNRICYHFRSIPQFLFLWIFYAIWPPVTILDTQKSLSIAFLAISGQYGTFNFWQNSCRWPFWMSENHFRSHFWSFQIDRSFWMSEIHFRSHFWPFQINLPFWMAENHLLSHFWPFDMVLSFIFEFFWQNGPQLDGTTMSIIELVRDIWMSNACVKFEERI